MSALVASLPTEVLIATLALLTDAVGGTGLTLTSRAMQRFMYKLRSLRRWA